MTTRHGTRHELTIRPMGRLDTGPLPLASRADTARVLATVLGPLVARGLILRRGRVLALAARLDTDGRLVRTMQRLRNRYGTAPLRLRIPGRTVALVLAADDAERILRETPEPFTAATREKRAAMAHFQPHGVLVSRGGLRTERREFNEAVLEPGHATHRELGQRIAVVTREEAGRLRDVSLLSGHLTWDDFVPAWWRLVRRVVLGDRAREDSVTTDLLAGLRSDANWGPLHRRDTAARQRFRARLEQYVERPQPGSLAELVARLPAGPGVDKVDQLPQWLFAFDAAASASFSVLALLATHPEQAERARAEVDAGGHQLPYLRACVLEALRLWPTTPVILRDATRPTAWPGGVLASGATLAVVTPFLHRDDVTLPYADMFAPHVWLDGRGGVDTHRQEALLPFSAGPAACPGRDLVLLVTSTLLASVLERCEVTTGVSPLDAGRPLPRTLAPASLELLVRRRSAV